MKYINIAIDGPAGSGKSTVSQEFAKRHPEFLYINTGAMFRTYALYLLEQQANLEDQELLATYLPKIKVILEKEKVYLHECETNHAREVTDQIKEMTVAKTASKIASLKCVRDKLLLDQRAIASEHNVIMDGRDIGTVVLPNADLKIFLVASSEERAKRRLRELEVLNPTQTYDLATIKKEIDERDYNDSHREIAPLRKADDAIELKTDGMTVFTCCDAIEKIYFQLFK